MAREKNSESAPKKAAATKKKSSAAGKAAAQKPEKAVAAAGAAHSAPASSGGSAHRVQPSRVQPSETELYQEISVLAYQFYRERGGHHGAHEADWHRAEQQVRAKYNQ